MNWRRLSHHWKEPEPEASAPPGGCTCVPTDLPLGLAKFDCPVHGWEAQPEQGWPGPEVVIDTAAKRAQRLRARLYSMLGMVRALEAFAFWLTAITAALGWPLLAIAGAVVWLALLRARAAVGRWHSDAVFVSDTLRGATPR